MKLENQVCNLDLSRKLKSLGVPQESLFDWYECKNKQSKKIEYAAGHVNPFSLRTHKTLDIYSAFTVSELGEYILSNYVQEKSLDELFEKWISLKSHPDNMQLRFAVNVCPNDLANFLIWLIRNNSALQKQGKDS